MKLFIFLGNPGHKYKKTRHNTGFLFGDYLYDQWGGINWQNKFKGEIGEIIKNGEKIIFLKPQTFMNLSGESVRQVVSFYKIPLENILLIYDDKDIQFKKVKFKKKGSSGGHNGLKSIFGHLNTQEIQRIKIGIENRTEIEFNNISTPDFVLSKFQDQELEILQKEIFPEAEKIALSIIKES